MIHLSADLICDFVIANVLGELVKYLVVKVAKKVDAQNETFLD